MHMQLMANVGLLATRWRLRTRSDAGSSERGAARTAHTSPSSGPWAALSRARRASSPNQTSPSRSTTPTGTHGAHASRAVATSNTTDSGFRASMHAATLAGTACTRSRAAGSLHLSDSLIMSDSIPGTTDRGKPGSIPNPNSNPGREQGRDRGTPDGSASIISSVSTATAPAGPSRQSTYMHGVSRTLVATGASVSADDDDTGRSLGFARNPATPGGDLNGACLSFKRIVGLLIMIVAMYSL